LKFDRTAVDAPLVEAVVVRVWTAHLSLRLLDGGPQAQPPDDAVADELGERPADASFGDHLHDLVADGCARRRDRVPGAVLAVEAVPIAFALATTAARRAS